VSTAETIMFRAPRLAFRTVMLAVDLSPLPERPFQLALKIARLYAATLLVAHIVPAEQVVDYPGDVDRLKVKLGKRLLQGVGGELPDVQQEVLIQHGDVCPLLIGHAAQHHADLIVLGTRDPVGLEKLIEGSVAGEVAHRVTVPVLTVGPKVFKAPEFGRVLYLTDFSDASAHAIPYAVSFAEDCGAALDLLHVNDPDTGETPHEAARKLREFVRDEIRNRGFGEVFGRMNLQFGPRTERIVEFASDRKIDIIVMGQRHTSPTRARIGAHLAGGMAQSLIALAPCAVMTVSDSTSRCLASSQI